MKMAWFFFDIFVIQICFHANLESRDQQAIQPDLFDHARSIATGNPNCWWRFSRVLPIFYILYYSSLFEHRQKYKQNNFNFEFIENNIRVHFLYRIPGLVTMYTPQPKPIAGFSRLGCHFSRDKRWQNNSFLARQALACT